MKPLDALSDEELLLALRQAVRDLPDAPPAWQAAAIGIFKRPAASPQQAPAAMAAGSGGLASALRRLQATLSFDSWAQSPMALGLRASQPSATRQLAYVAAGHDIDLRVAPSGAGFQVAGQVLGPADQGEVELRRVSQGLELAHSGALDELGEFRIDGLPAGRWQCTLRLADAAIELPPLDIGEHGD